jgi:hypothetical protein
MCPSFVVGAHWVALSGWCTFKCVKYLLDNGMHDWYRNSIAELLIAVGVGLVRLKPFRKALKTRPFARRHSTDARIVSSSFQQFFCPSLWRHLGLNQIALSAHATNYNSICMSIVRPNLVAKTLTL